MDMKKILQSLDNVSTKPVEGTDGMAKFLRIVREADLNQITSEVPGAAASVADQINSYIRYSSGLYKKGMSNITIKPGLVLPITFTPIPPTGDSFKIIRANVATANARLPKDLQIPADQLSNMVGGADKPYSGPTANEDNNSMKRFLNVVSETTLSRQVYLGGYTTLYLQQIVVSNQVKDGITPQQALAELKSRVGNLDPHNGEPPSPDFIKKYLSKRLEEGANPHKVTLPVQMAMQHYQQPSATVKPRTRLIDKYFTEAEATILQKKQEEKMLLKQYAQVIAERVLTKDNFNPNMSPNPGFKPTAGPGIMSSVAEFATTGGGAATGNPNITNKKTIPSLLPKAALEAKPIDISIQGSGLDTNIVVEGVEVYGVGDFLLDLGFTVGIAALGAALSTPTAGNSARIAFGAISIPARRAFAYVIKHVSNAAKTHPELVSKEAISAYVKTKSEFFKELIKSEFTSRAMAFTMGATAGFNTVVGVLEKNGVPLPDWLKKDKPFDPENPAASVKIK